MKQVVNIMAFGFTMAPDPNKFTDASHARSHATKGRTTQADLAAAGISVGQSW